MALYQTRIIIDRSAFGEDNAVWGVFGVDSAVDPQDLAEDMRDAWAAAFTAEFDANVVFGSINYFSVLELAPAAGGAAVGIAAFDPPLELGPSNNRGPAEVALVVSEWVSTIRGDRPRGRLYVGSFAPEVMQQYPSNALCDSVGALLTSFHDAVVLAGATPVVISKVEGGVERVAPVGWPILSYSIDNAWDTQRRRGTAPTNVRTYFPS